MQVTPQFGDAPQRTLFDLLGPEKLAQVVERFYSQVPHDPDLAPIFPEDLSETAKKQLFFLTQFFGGPPLFSQVYGSPMLRARHLPHEITPTRARAWVALMAKTMEEVGVEPALREVLMDRLARVAVHMVNTPDPPSDGPATGPEAPEGAKQAAGT